MPEPGWRMVLYVNEFGSVVHAPGPRVELVPVMPVSEHERWRDAFLEGRNADLAALRGRLTIAEDALRAIAAPDCMVSHHDDGGWIDTDAPARIAEGALDRVRQHEDSDAPRGQDRP